jgi:hypothetical protein
LEVKIVIVIDVGKEVDGVVYVFAEVCEFGLTLLDLGVVGLRYKIEGLVEFVLDH